MEPKRCAQCGEPISRANPRAIYCGKACQQQRHDQQRAQSRAEEHARARRERYHNGAKYRDLAHRRAKRTDRPKPMFCEEPGCTNPPRDKHHDDYSKPLEIRWLCRSCHMKWHAQNLTPANPRENLHTPGHDSAVAGD